MTNRQFEVMMGYADRRLNVGRIVRYMSHEGRQAVVDTGFDLQSTRPLS
jgi:hypothetical protein